jgi:hypothetical protein
MASSGNARRASALRIIIPAVVVVVVAAGVVAGVVYRTSRSEPPLVNSESEEASLPRLAYKKRVHVDNSGSVDVLRDMPPWKQDAPLIDIARTFDRIGFRKADAIDQSLSRLAPDDWETEIPLFMRQASCFAYEGDAKRAYDCVTKARGIAIRDPLLAEKWMFTLIYRQGVLALRRGETENCVLCRGASSCIIPIDPSAVHTNPEGSRLAIRHFTEYLRQFPNDLEVKWLLNVAHMTLGEYPNGVDPAYLISLDRWTKSEFDIGKFRDIGHLVGVNRLNQAGGAVMDDFDNDGLLDIVTTTLDPTGHMAFFKNMGDGTFEDRTERAHLTDQLGGLNVVQVDYNNDGHLDLFVPRGAWLNLPMRPSLLRNNGDGTFTDVTKEAGLLDPINSISASWADYDNDGFPDLFICCEQQVNRLYHNKGDGTFEEVAARAGVQGAGQTSKGCVWFDYDNDGYPDLFVNNYTGPARLYHNNRNGTFTDVTKEMGIVGPTKMGFSCWAFDFDNDGYLDLYATCYESPTAEVVKGLIGEPTKMQTGRLYRNMAGKGFQDVTKEAGLDLAFATMGSNFADFDNDGYLDFYLGTGWPDYAALVPNRMFKNVGGKRFSEVTVSSGTGHLQKGHGVACGDWDRDGNVDIFIEMGGLVPGDKYHNVLFQNPGHENHWLTVKLVGKKTNRSAIGARIKVVTAGPASLTVHRHVSSGSSFGGNPLQQTIGLGKADRIATLEVFWPTSGTTQVFRDVAIDQAIEVTEFATDVRKLDWKSIKVPSGN